MTAEEIANVSLSIGSIKLRPNNPFKWASGYRMPIYNDNRMLLGNYDHRMLVANELKKIIEDNKIECDYIAGIPTAGIAPAASLAKLMDVPLIIYDKNEFIKAFNYKNIKSELAESFDKENAVIASTCPYGIPAGINIANNLKKPFIYVRQNKKDHGMERKIEGIVLENQNAFLLDISLNTEESYAASAVDAIYEVTKKPVALFRHILPKEVVNISGKKILVLEDLISTGKSSVDEIVEYRKKGAIVDNLLSIFNYGIADINQKFANEKINVYSALYYDTLLKVAKQTKYIDVEQENLLAEWRLDAFNWGEKHGFPKDSKPV